MVTMFVIGENGAKMLTYLVGFILRIYFQRKEERMKEFKIIATAITYLLIGALEAHCYYLFRADAIIALAVITLLGFIVTFGIVVIKD